MPYPFFNNIVHGDSSVCCIRTCTTLSCVCIRKIYHASDAGINAHTVTKSKGNKSSEGYIVLKNNISKVVQKFDYKYDIIFDVYVPADGKYTLETVVEPSDAEALKKKIRRGA